MAGGVGDVEVRTGRTPGAPAATGRCGREERSMPPHPIPPYPIWRCNAKGRSTFVGAAWLHRGALQPPPVSSHPVTPQSANDPASSSWCHCASVTPARSSGPLCAGVSCDGDGAWRLLAIPLRCSGADPGSLWSPPDQRDWDEGDNKPKNCSMPWGSREPVCRARRLRG